MGVPAFFRWLVSVYFCATFAYEFKFKLFLVMTFLVFFYQTARYPKILVDVLENLSGDVLEGEQVDLTKPNENDIEFDNLVFWLAHPM